MRSGCTPAIKSGNLSYSVSLPRNVLEIGYELCDAVDEGQARIFVVFHADKCHPHVYIYYIAGGRTGSERLDRPDPGLHPPRGARPAYAAEASSEKCGQQKVQGGWQDPS